MLSLSQDIALSVCFDETPRPQSQIDLSRGKQQAWAGGSLEFQRYLAVLTLGKGA